MCLFNWGIGKEMGTCCFHLRGNGMHLGMEFITNNNVLIKRHNKLIKIPSKNGIVRMKAYEVPSVGGSTIHLMLNEI
jgi:hypothetical protein